MRSANAVSPLLRSLSRPHGFEPLRVEGRLPESLRGTLFRAGPGLFERFGTRIAHAFEADGAVTAVRFDGGGAQGASRIVESAGFRAEEQAGRFLYTSSASWLDRMRAARKDVAKTTGNTSTFLWKNRLFALMENGLLQEMSPTTLETLDATGLGVVTGAFSAHPHRVASLRTTFNFGVRYGRKMNIDLYALPDDGEPSKLGTVEAPWQSMVHDFMATERHLILFVGPVRLKLLRAMVGLGDVTQLFEWRPELGARLIVVPLDAIHSPRTFELDPFWLWHFSNAYEEVDGPCVDFCRYPEFSLGEIGEMESTGPLPLLTRVQLDLRSGKARETKLFDVPCDFPQVHPRLHGARHGTVFAQTERNVAGRSILGVTRIDLDRGRSAEWVLPAGHVPSEPVLVPREASQDATFVLDLVFDSKAHHSYVAVLDGEQLEDGPLATVHFDQAIPVTFHGSFAAAG
ncbi:carotenoid oxygenase family protein [Myxococcus sp. SDU36]|uniref:carotenoid oxygenase family protein n=1 Tax=Myxococcus sp. SDU36 TaxID=2831967 RepID=UPI002543F9D3|nr:carotenoid oxygenase family protein [Myxococcus sp. SDU36]WIG95637.1 carotenoid oxygenase family protein [Myxococcus sp. SDU36]